MLCGFYLPCPGCCPPSYPAALLPEGCSLIFTNLTANDVRETAVGTAVHVRSRSYLRLGGQQLLRAVHRNKHTNGKRMFLYPLTLVFYTPTHPQHTHLQDTAGTAVVQQKIFIVSFRRFVGGLS